MLSLLSLPARHAHVLCCAGLYDFSARDNHDLEMRRGDQVEIVADHYGWCMARSARGVGYVPGNYLEPPRWHHAF